MIIFEWRAFVSWTEKKRCGAVQSEDAKCLNNNASQLNRCGVAHEPNQINGPAKKL